jgi:D-alanyl-lipoteichoic acid acyltransferase DltB (MBOAT superfamily)
MEITSFYFLCFYTVLLILYYVLPGKMQWVLLLVSSIAFYLLSGSPWLILYPAAAVTVTFFCTRCMDTAPAEQKAGAAVPSQAAHAPGTGRTAALLIDIVLLIGTLAALKYLKFGGGSRFRSGFPFIRLSWPAMPSMFTTASPSGRRIFSSWPCTVFTFRP